VIPNSNKHSPKAKKNGVPQNFLPLLSVPIVLIFFLAYFFVIPMLWKQKGSIISVAEQHPEMNREKTEPVSKVLESVSKPENKDEEKEKNSAKEKPEVKDKAQLAEKPKEDMKKTEPPKEQKVAKTEKEATPAPPVQAPLTAPAPVQATANEKPVAPKAEAHNQSGHTITAEYYQPDKSVIIVDLYPELKKIRDQKDSKNKSISIKLPEGVELKKDEMLLSYILSKYKLDPAKQLAIANDDLSGNYILSIRLPEKLQEMKDDELLSTCFATLSMMNKKNVTIQFIKPEKSIKNLSDVNNPKSEVAFSVPYTEVIREVSKNLEHSGTNSMDFPTKKIFVCYSELIGSDSNLKQKMSPYLRLIDTNGTFETSLKDKNLQTNMQIKLVSITKVQLYYPYFIGEIPNQIITSDGTLKPGFINEQDLKHVRNKIGIYIQKYLDPVWKKPHIPLLGDDVTLQNFPPTIYYLYTNQATEEIEIKIALTYHKFVIDTIANGSDNPHIQFKNKGFFSDSKKYFQDMRAECEVINQALMDHPNTIPPISFQLTFDQNRDPYKHWWTSQSKNISENQLNSLKKSRLIFAEFTEQK
jgi:hypothetical protein